MRQTALFAATLAALTVSAGAQQLVTPPHAVGLEGNSSSGITFTNAATRTMQSDGNLVGSGLRLLRSMTFRRNGSDLALSIARTVDVQIDMGYSVATFTNTFDNNFEANTKTTVFSLKQVSLPDWTVAPPTPPADFDLTIKFDTPFVNDNVRTPIFDILCSNNSQPGSTYRMDWFSTVPTLTKGERPEALGTGCTTANGVFTYTFETQADATNMSVLYAFRGAASNAPCVAMIGGTDPNVNIGLCTNLRSDLTFVLPLGVSDGTGTFGLNAPIPWSSGLAGLRLISQGFCLDATQPGLPFALSNGVSTTTPYVVGGGGATAIFKINRLFTSTGQGPTGTLATTCIPVLWSV
ncbi:MAG TPA: hypothetical protein PKE00_01530 [Planctomycetota bacterium]|nr:hypothetical protein [Planctomycetota bacterium]